MWGWDKWQARRGGPRVPEAVLHVMAAAGATPASFAAMEVFRHKTLKRHFRILYTVLLIVQIALLLYFMTAG